MSACDDLRLALGSYALGGLEPAETKQVERHLTTCAACRREFEELAPLPRLLDLVDPGRSAAPAPSPALEDSVVSGFAARRDLRTAARRRARGRWRVAIPSALAGAAAAVALVAATGGLSSPGGDERTVTLASIAGGPPSVSARARLSSTATGTEVDLDARLPPLGPGEVYELWFVRGSGRVSAGTFSVGADGRAAVRLATAARSGSYARLGITREPDGLDPARNGPTVVTGRVTS